MIYYGWTNTPIKLTFGWLLINLPKSCNMLMSHQSCHLISSPIHEFSFIRLDGSWALLGLLGGLDQLKKVNHPNICGLFHLNLTIVYSKVKQSYHKWIPWAREGIATPQKSNKIICILQQLLRLDQYLELCLLFKILESIINYYF